MELVRIPPIELPIDTFRIYLDKLRILLENPISRENVLHPISSGCHETARLIFNIVEYITQWINDPDTSSEFSMDKRLLPYLPFFIAKDVTNLTSNNYTFLRNYNYAIRPKPDTTIHTFERLIEFSREYVVHFTFSGIEDPAVTHYFSLYNGKICSAWGSEFYVFYVEKEITADDLMFFMKFNPDSTSKAEKLRFRTLVGKYLLDIENFHYYTLNDITYINDERYTERTNLLVNKIFPIISWIFELDDNLILKGIEPPPPPYYEEINRLILDEWPKIRPIFLKRGITVPENPMDTNPMGPNQVLFETEREGLVPKNIKDFKYEEEIERKKILNELLSSFLSYIDRNDASYIDINNADLIEDIESLYIDGVEDGTHQLYGIMLDKRSVEDREIALVLNKKKENGTITPEELHQLNNNSFYNRYNTVVDENSLGQVISIIMYEDAPETALYKPYRRRDYNKTTWNKMFDIIDNFTMIPGISSISRDNPLITAYGERMSQLSRITFMSEYYDVMEKYNNNVELIIQKLNEAYRAMGLFEPGEHPILMPNEDACVGPIHEEENPSKLKKVEHNPPVPPPPPANQLVSASPMSFSMGAPSSPRRPVTRSVTRSFFMGDPSSPRRPVTRSSKPSKGGTRRRRSRRTKQKRKRRTRRTKKRKNFR